MPTIPPVPYTRLDYTLHLPNDGRVSGSVELLPDLLAQVGAVWSGQQRSDAASLRFFASLSRHTGDILGVRIEGVLSPSPPHTSQTGLPHLSSEALHAAVPASTAPLPPSLGGTSSNPQENCCPPA